MHQASAVAFAIGNSVVTEAGHCDRCTEHAAKAETWCFPAKVAQAQTLLLESLLLSCSDVVFV